MLYHHAKSLPFDDLTLSKQQAAFFQAFFF